MPKRDAFSRGLALAGTALAWFPFVAMLATSRLFGPRPRIDYLMPAELFPMVVVGGVVLMWAALRVRSRVKTVAWGLGGAIGGLVVVSALAMGTGLASGATSPSSAPVAWMAVIATLVVYVLACLELGVAGILLTRDAFTPLPVSRAQA